MYWATVAAALWATLGLSIVIGAAAARTTHDRVAAAMGLISVVGITVFSWYGALSIGAFVIAVAVVLAAIVATRHLSIWLRVVAALLGVVGYWGITWTWWPLSQWALLLLPGLCIALLLGALAIWETRARVTRVDT